MRQKRNAEEASEVSGACLPRFLGFASFLPDGLFPPSPSLSLSIHVARTTNRPTAIKNFKHPRKSDASILTFDIWEHSKFGLPASAVE